MEDKTVQSKELTPEAKEAINNYLLRLFAVFGITNLVLLLGALVYVVFILPTQAARQAVTRVEAQVDSSVQTLLNKSAEAYEQLGRARELSERVKVDTQKDLDLLGEEASKLRAELARVRNEVGTLENNDTVGVVKAAAVLRDNPKVVDALNLLPRIERLEKQLRDSAGNVGRAGSGHVVLGDKMIQWGSSEWHSGNARTQGFKPAFGSDPVVVCSVDSADQNDAYCNVLGVQNDRFRFFAVRQGIDNYAKFTISPRRVFWIAIGSLK